MVEAIFIGLMALSIIVGVVSGGGRVLKRITDGKIGKLLTIIFCYFTFCLVLALPVSQNLLVTIAEKIESINSKVLSFLILTIRLDLVIFAIIFYFVVVLFRKLIVFLLELILEIDCLPFKIINKILGVVLSFLWLVIVILIVFQILAWTTGLDGVVYQRLEGSFLGLDKLFQNNPLNALINSINIKDLLVAK